MEDQRKDSKVAAPLRAYERPAVVWEEWLDMKSSLVMACAKTNPLAGPPCSQGVAAS